MQSDDLTVIFYVYLGRERLCLAGSEPFRVVLESDGTQVILFNMLSSFILSDI